MELGLRLYATGRRYPRLFASLRQGAKIPAKARRGVATSVGQIHIPCLIYLCQFSKRFDSHKVLFVHNSCFRGNGSPLVGLKRLQTQSEISTMILQSVTLSSLRTSPTEKCRKSDPKSIRQLTLNGMALLRLQQRPADKRTVTYSARDRLGVYHRGRPKSSTIFKSL